MTYTREFIADVSESEIVPIVIRAGNIDGRVNWRNKIVIEKLLYSRV